MQEVEPHSTRPEVMLLMHARDNESFGKELLQIESRLQAINGFEFANGVELTEEQKEILMDIDADDITDLSKQFHLEILVRSQDSN